MIQPKNETDEPMWLLLVLVLYNVFLAGASIYTLVNIWPINPTQALNSTSVSSLKILTSTFDVSAEVRVLLVVITLGALGSFVHTATSLATFVGNKGFKKSWTAWYLMRPLIGSGLALLIYFTFRAGFVNPGTSTSDINLYGVAAISGLAGMFSKEATDKLADVFATLFKSEQNAQRKDKLQ